MIEVEAKFIRDTACLFLGAWQILNIVQLDPRKLSNVQASPNPCTTGHSAAPDTTAVPHQHVGTSCDKWVVPSLGTRLSLRESGSETRWRSTSYIACCVYSVPRTVPLRTARAGGLFSQPRYSAVKRARGDDMRALLKARERAPPQ